VKSYLRGEQDLVTFGYLTSFLASVLTKIRIREPSSRMSLAWVRILWSA